MSTSMCSNFSLRCAVLCCAVLCCATSCSDLAALYGQEGRRLVSDAVCGELIAAAAEGPRASDRFAAVSSAAVAGLAGSVRSAEVVANFVDRWAYPTS